MKSVDSSEHNPWLLDVRGTPPNRVPLNTTLTERLPEVRAALRDYGAVRIRGMSLVDDLRSELSKAAMTIVGLEPRPYVEQSSPRTEVGDGVFTATDYPNHAEIFLHNELSYAKSWPRMLFFYCGQPADQGGETVLADCRRVYRGIPADIRTMFEDRSWMYVRNLRGSAGLGWQSVFQTTSRTQVEAYCELNEIELSWTRDGARLRAVRPATLELRPPDGDGPAWFNHVAAFHLSTLPDSVARSLRRVYAPEDLPVNTYFGDGEPIPDEVVEEIRAAHRRVAVDIHWQQGDLVVVDNHRVAHGRRPYQGTRKVFVVLAGEGHH